MLSDTYGHAYITHLTPWEKTCKFLQTLFFDLACRAFLSSRIVLPFTRPSTIMAHSNRKGILVRFYIHILTTLLFLAVFSYSANAQEQPFPSFRTVGFMEQQIQFDQTPGSTTQFSVYRARFGMAGRLTENIRFNVVGGLVEPPQRNPQLVNAFIDFDIHPLLQLRAGQFLAPFGLEGPEVITLNPAIERSLAIRRMNTLAMFRDVGIQASGSFAQMGYAIALTNGSGANNPDPNNTKDIMGRVYYNVTEVLQVGLSGHAGSFQVALAGGNESEQRRWRTGIDFFYRGSPIFTRGEYQIRNDKLPAGDLKSQGGYLLAGYRINERVESIVRLEYLDPSDVLDNVELTVFTAGINYYLAGQSRISANYEIRDDKMNPNLGNLITIQLQMVL